MKKFLCLLLVVLILMSFSACGNSDDSGYQADGQDIENESIDGENDDVADNDSDSKSSEITEGLLFTTEYTVEDYVENAIIVSKNDGLLYGVLDNKGNEVIPVQYDELEFLNKEAYVTGEDDNIYFTASYEDEYYYLDIEGNKILTSVSDSLVYEFNYCDLMMNVEKTDSVPFVYEGRYGEYKIYNESGKLLYDIDSEYHLDMFINEKYYLAKDELGHGMAVCDYSGNTLFSTDDMFVRGLVADTEYIVFVSANDEVGNYYKSYVIDSIGNVTEKDRFDDESQMTAEYEKLSAQYSENSFVLYKSNDTYKFEDGNGNSVFDDRYYAAYEFSSYDGSYTSLDKMTWRSEFNFDYYALVNEDNQVILVGNNAKKYIDYGTLTLNSESLILNVDGSSKTVKYILKGKESVIIPVSSSNGGYDIYYYGAK